MGDGGKGWSRTTVLGFSDRRANRVRHLPIFVLLDAFFGFYRFTVYYLKNRCLRLLMAGEVGYDPTT